MRRLLDKKTGPQPEAGGNPCGMLERLALPAWSTKTGPRPPPGRLALPAAKQVGFTLVEVLVALAILAIALSAAVRAASIATDSAYDTKLRTLATWIAQNRISELTARVAVSKVLPGAGENEGKSSQGGIELSWTQNIAETPNPAFRKVEVKVLRPASTQVLVSLNAYLVLP